MRRITFAARRDRTWAYDLCDQNGLVIRPERYAPASEYGEGEQKPARAPTNQNCDSVADGHALDGRGQVSGSKLAITLVAMGGALMAFIDISIVNVALSDMRASFGTPLDQIGWVSTGYTMANIVVIPMTGWFQRRFGFRRYFTGSVLLLAAASALCGVAWNLPSLVLFRVLQGLGGGAIIPTSQSLLFARYPKSEHGTAAGLFGLGAVTGPLLGPTLRGCSDVHPHGGRGSSTTATGMLLRKRM